MYDVDSPFPFSPSRQEGEPTDNVFQNILNTPQRRMRARRQVSRQVQENINGSPRRRRVAPSQPLKPVRSAEGLPSLSSNQGKQHSVSELVRDLSRRQSITHQLGVDFSHHSRSVCTCQPSRSQSHARYQCQETCRSNPTRISGFVPGRKCLAMHRDLALRLTRRRIFSGLFKHPRLQELGHPISSNQTGP